jgi:hypothetical protein
MYKYLSSLSRNVSFASLGMLVAGRPVAETVYLKNPEAVGIYLPAPLNAATQQPASDVSSGPLAMLLSEDTRQVLGMQPLPEFSAPRRDTPDPAPEAVANPTGVPAAAGTVSSTGRIGNRRQALAALNAFEAQREARLPQLGAGGRQSAALAMGVVQFRDLNDLLTTFPCTAAVPGEPIAEAAGQTEAGGFLALTQAGVDGFLSVPRKACIGPQEVVVTRDPSNHRRIRYSIDLQGWQPAAVYTDDVVETEKLAMWTRIFTEALQRSAGPPAHA